MPDVQEVFRMATQKVRPDPGALERQNRDQRRRAVTRRAGGYALLAILVIAAVVIGVVATRPREERPAGQGEQEAPSTAELATKPYFLDLDTGEVTLLPESLESGYSYVASPDGTKLAYSGSGTAGAIRVANIDGTVLRTIRPPEGFEDYLPRWSPDGTKIVYQEREADSGDDVGNLFVYDLSTEAKAQITDLELTRASFYDLWPSFSGEGTEIIFHLPRGSSETAKSDVWSAPVTGGELTLVLRNAAFPMLGPGPEGEEIAFVLPGPDNFASLMTGRPTPESDLRQTLVEANFSIWWPTMSPDGNRIAYQDGASIYVVSLLTGESSKVADGDTAEWLDEDTLIVTP